MDGEDNFLPTMKLSEKKTTFPGRKQVYRIRDSRGKFLKDILALEGERAKGQPLLRQVVCKGEIIYNKPTLSQIRDFAKSNLEALGDKYKKLTQPSTYPVIINPGLKKLTRDLTVEIKNRQNQQNQGHPSI
jgi:nicotinate phosphoribosyltransferase